MASSLLDILSRDSLRFMAGGRSFERGENYYLAGKVRALLEEEDSVVAVVEGMDEYNVRLSPRGDEVEYSCTCPVGAEGEFCKHCVAVGLAVLAGDASADSAQASARPTSMAGVRAYLEQQDKTTLVGMLMEQVMHDSRLRERLVLTTASANPQAPNFTAYYGAIDQAVEMDEGYDSYNYYSTGFDLDKISSVVDSIEDLLQNGHAAEVIELTEYFLDGMEDQMDNVHDEEGEVAAVLERLQDRHYDACAEAKPDPEELAERLFSWEVRTDYDIFYGAHNRYADLLGERGLAVYRRLTEAEWARVPALGPGDEGSWADNRWRITSIMEDLARMDGDLEGVAAVRSRDLSSPHRYVQVAEVYKEAGNDDRALEWAERGMRDFPREKLDARLREFLAEEYHRRNRHSEAMAIAWDEFEEAARLGMYENLKRHADRAGQWTQWREKALTFLHERLTPSSPEEANVIRSYLGRAGYSELVHIFLWEGYPETAWREALEGGCTNDLWLKLARTCEQEHPEDALEIYLRQIEPLVEQTNNDSYAAAVEYLLKVRDLMTKLGQDEEFFEYVEALRTTYKRKRNFLKMLDARL